MKQNRMLAARGEGTEVQTGEDSWKVQTSRYKINKSWECNVLHGEYS